MAAAHDDGAPTYDELTERARGLLDRLDEDSTDERLPVSDREASRILAERRARLL